MVKITHERVHGTKVFLSLIVCLYYTFQLTNNLTATTQTKNYVFFQNTNKVRDKNSAHHISIKVYAQIS